MRVAPADLESAALDRSATCAKLKFQMYLITFNQDKLEFDIIVKQVGLCSVNSS